MNVVTVTNQKGGVGKTAIALHLAFAARDRGLRVLLVDLDSQGNATIALKAGALPAYGGAATLFNDELVVPTVTGAGIDLLHGHQRLDELDAQFHLQQAIQIGHKLRDLPYELVVLDTPPAIGLRQVGPVLWCDRCVLPLEPSGFGLSGLSQSLATLTRVHRFNPGLRSLAVVNRYDRRSRQQAAHLAELARRIELAKPFLALRVAVAEALDLGIPVWRFAGATRDTRQQWLELCGGVLDALDR